MTRIEEIKKITYFAIVFIEHEDPSRTGYYWFEHAKPEVTVEEFDAAHGPFATEEECKAHELEAHPGEEGPPELYPLIFGGGSEH